LWPRLGALGLNWAVNDHLILKRVSSRSGGEEILI
jgi:hypothetical protein